MLPYSDTIRRWAQEYGVDIVIAAALFWRESFAEAKRRGVPPETILSSAGAVGIGQIMPLHIGSATPWGQPLTAEDLTNADRNIRWALWFFAQKVRDVGGGYDAGYAQGYNPGYPGPPLTSLLPKGYVPEAGLTPREQAEETVQQQQQTEGVKAELYDRWVVRNPNGTLGFAPIKDASKPPPTLEQIGKDEKGRPAKPYLILYENQPLTLTTLTRARSRFDTLFLAYAGRTATNREVANLLEANASDYGIAITLSKKPEFFKSPIWKSHANGIIGKARELYGQNWKPKGAKGDVKSDFDWIRRAIAEDWDPATLDTNLRNRPDFLQGPVFKTGMAQFSNVFQTIYGTPNKQSQQNIREAVANGWSTDQWAMWLRAQPEYTYSVEYLDKALQLGDALGLITGAVPTLVSGAPPKNTQPPLGGGLPDNQLVQGKPGRVADLPPLVVGRGTA